MYLMMVNISVCVAGYNMLVDGSCSKLRKSEQFNLKERNKGIISGEAIVLQVLGRQKVIFGR